MSPSLMIITIIIIAIATALTRFLPFVLFPNPDKLPRFIKYLSDLLPYAVIGILVVYCLKEVTISNLSDFIAHIVAIACIVLIHVWKRNVLISILTGTICYMALLHLQ